MMRSFLVFFSFSLMFIQCATYKPYYDKVTKSPNPTDSEIDQTILFFGGSGAITKEKDGLLLEAQRQIAENDKSSVIVLGNITPKNGLNEADDAADQYPLNRLVELLKAHNGKSYIVPGYEDWDKGRKAGWNEVIKLEDFIEDHLGDDILLPSHACPGPVEYELSTDVTVLLLNTQWYLHRNEKPDVNTGCDMESSFDFLVQLEDAVRRNIDKKLVIVGYHPLFSNGPHGGFSSAATHLLPPVLGSIGAWYKKNLGGFQDLAEIRYRLMKRGLTKVFEQHPNLIYLSGHERSQQYHAVGEQHYIVSGTLGKATRVAKDNGASFAYGKPGFGKLTMYKNGDVFLEFFIEEDGVVKQVYEKALFNHVYDESIEDKETYYADLDFSGQVKTTNATDKLNRKAGKTKPGFLGENYRKEWSATIEDVRVFDIGKEKGGLKIIKRGGGFQTKSLRLEAKSGKQYVLRSVEKFPEKAVPAMLRGTIASKIVEDQVSASHPYAALVVPYLAEAAGVYHANPELVYLPDDPRLGKYRSDFGGGLFLFEERPDDDQWKDDDSFDNPDDIISTLDLVKKMQKNDKQLIDQEHTIKSRLFDTWIGDWDRHDDQWRWAKYEQEDGTNLYRPIPRDRDQAFFLGDGTLINVMSRKWAIPRFEGFHDEIRFVPGMQLSGHFFDLTFLTEAEREDWQRVAKEMQANLTDEIIEYSIKQFPKEIYDLRGEEIIAKLKIRRDDLAKYADELYLFRSQTVDVLGSNKAELFEVNRINDQETEVKMYRIKESSGDVKRLAYSRLFKVGETKEIRLYGFGDDDRFEVKGDVRNAIKVRIIGGKGKDLITDHSSVRGLSKRTIVYDSKAEVSSKGELKSKINKKNKSINDYNRYSSKFDVLVPVVTGSFNPDDGIFLGGGVSIVKHGFRKDPFASKHTFSAAIAPKSASYNFKYNGQLNQVIGKWGLGFDATISEPSFADFFYGFGNKTVSDEDLRDEDTQFYRARYSQWRFGTEINRNWNDESHSVSIGSFYRSVKINSDQNDEEPNRFISTYPDAIARGEGSNSPLLDERRNYAGLILKYTCDFTDSPSLPTRGIRINAGARAVRQIGDEENEYQSLNSDFSTFLTFGGSVRTTLAVRVGGEVNFGEFEFYQAPRLGGLTNLRGYRRARFAGDESFYQNTDLRIKLFDFYTPIFPGSFGVVLSHDVGRVWTDQVNTINVDESFEDWHRGYGGGIWLSPFGKAVISADYMTSNNDEVGVFFVRMGFLF